MKVEFQSRLFQNSVRFFAIQLPLAAQWQDNDAVAGQENDRALVVNIGLRPLLQGKE